MSGAVSHDAADPDPGGRSQNDDLVMDRDLHGWVGSFLSVRYDLNMHDRSEIARTSRFSRRRFFYNDVGCSLIIVVVTIFLVISAPFSRCTTKCLRSHGQIRDAK